MPKPPSKRICDRCNTPYPASRGRCEKCGSPKFSLSPEPTAKKAVKGSQASRKGRKQVKPRKGACKACGGTRVSSSGSRCVPCSQRSNK